MTGAFLLHFPAVLRVSVRVGSGEKAGVGTSSKRTWHLEYGGAHPPRCVASVQEAPQVRTHVGPGVPLPLQRQDLR